MSAMQLHCVLPRDELLFAGQSLHILFPDSVLYFPGVHAGHDAAIPGGASFVAKQGHNAYPKLFLFIQLKRRLESCLL